MPIARRSFVAASAAVCVTPLPTVRAATLRRYVDGGLPSTFPTQDPEDVRTVVGRSHVDYDAVRELVTARPELAKASWDWGFGDWESALGAASHMGRRDIATLLVDHGARPNLFTFAMLGQVDAVRAICRANPGIQRQPGPHGINLMRHAVNGGDEARPVVEYLEELGDADLELPDEPLSPDQGATYVGTYAPRGVPGVEFRVTYHERRRGITFARDDGQFRFLRHAGDGVFHPGGAASVRIRFDVVGDRAATLTIRDGELAIVADRTA